MSTAIFTYLTFDGDCRAAMEFYKGVFDAELHIMAFSDAPPGMCPPSERVMHARLQAADVVLLASDMMPGSSAAAFVHGTDFSVTLQCTTIEEQDRYFAALSEGGQVTMLLQEMFWGARFGMLSDRFGFRWMLNCDLPKDVPVVWKES